MDETYEDTFDTTFRYSDADDLFGGVLDDDHYPDLTEEEIAAVADD